MFTIFDAGLTCRFGPCQTDAVYRRRGGGHFEGVTQKTEVHRSAQNYRGSPSRLHRGGVAYQNSKFPHTTPVGKSPPKYPELAGVEYPGNLSLTAKEMAKLIAFLKINGGFKQVPTQALGNCLYASVLRGTDVPLEFTTTHLRRFIVMKMTEEPEFWYKCLSYAIAFTYGFDRDYTPEEINRREREGLMTAQAAQDARLPGPFSFVSFLNHINTDGTWGDDLILTIISCLWQVSVTILNCEKLTETRIRHNIRLNDADLVVLFVEGNHYMGCGK